MVVDFGTLYLTGFQYFLRLSIVLSGFTFFKPFRVYLCIFSWICDLGGYASSKGVKKGFGRSERFSFGLLSCNYFEK